MNPLEALPSGLRIVVANEYVATTKRQHWLTACLVDEHGQTLGFANAFQGFVFKALFCDSVTDTDRGNLVCWIGKRKPGFDSVPWFNHNGEPFHGLPKA